MWVSGTHGPVPCLSMAQGCWSPAYWLDYSLWKCCLAECIHTVPTSSSLEPLAEPHNSGWNLLTANRIGIQQGYFSEINVRKPGEIAGKGLSNVHLVFFTCLNDPGSWKGHWPLAYSTYVRLIVDIVLYHEIKGRIGMDSVLHWALDLSALVSRFQLP